jgi:hypothetical protein
MGSIIPKKLPKILLVSAIGGLIALVAPATISGNASGSLGGCGGEYSENLGATNQGLTSDRQDPADNVGALPTGAQGSSHAPLYNWRAGEYPPLKGQNNCMDFATTVQWRKTVLVSNEAELVKAIDNAAVATKIGITNDIVLSDKLYLRSNIWIYGHKGRHRLSPPPGTDWRTVEIVNAIPGEPNFKPSNIRITGLELLNVGVIVRSWSEDNTWRPEGISFVDMHFITSGPDTRAKPETIFQLLKFARAGSSTMAEPIDVCNSLLLGAWDSAETTSFLSLAQIWRSHRVSFRDNAFLGVMKTAINVNGSRNTNDKGTTSTTVCNAANASGTCQVNWHPDHHCKNIEIANNIIQREPYPTPTGMNEETYKDHGLYVWGAEKVDIAGNSIQGWSATAHGGCVKMASTRGARVTNNICGSGMLLYTHVYNTGGCDPVACPSKGCLAKCGTPNDGCVSSTALPHFSAPPLFQNVTIANNSICTNAPHNCVMIYMRYRIATEMPWPSGDLQGEKNVVIQRNELNGGAINIRSTISVGCSTIPHPLDRGFNPRGFTIADNTGLGDQPTYPACLWPGVLATGNRRSNGKLCQ